MQQPQRSSQEPTLADLLPVIEIVLGQQAEISRRGLQEPDGGLVARLYQDASQHVDECCYSSPLKSAWDCRPGCSACCHQSVPVTAIEALMVAEFVTAQSSLEQLAEIKTKLEANVQQYNELDRPQRGFTRIRCAFLGANGECTVYPVRPLRCRGFHSLSAYDCDAVCSGNENVAIPIDPATNVSMRAVQSGMSGALKQHALDGDYYELNSAVLVALTTDNARQRWQDGEPIFATCTRPAALPHVVWVAPQEDGSLISLVRVDNRRDGEQDDNSDAPAHEIRVVQLDEQYVHQSPVWHVARPRPQDDQADDYQSRPNADAA